MNSYIYSCTICVFTLYESSVSTPRWYAALCMCNVRTQTRDIKKPWGNSLEIWSFSCRHCSALGSLQVSSIMQHWALLDSIKESLLYFRNKPAVRFFMSHSVFCTTTIALVAFWTKILSCKWHHVHFYFTVSPQHRVTSTACKQMFNFFFFLSWKGKCSAILSLFQMWNCSDFNKQASNWGFRPREVQSLIW